MYFVTKQPEGNVVDVDDWNGVNKSAGGSCFVFIIIHDKQIYLSHL